MKSELAILSTPETPLALTPAMDQARRFVEASKAPATIRAYRSDWCDFCGWCTDHGLTPLPTDPGTVALYLAERAAVLKPATLTRRLAAISKAHGTAGHPSPASLRNACVGEVVAGIRRMLGVAQQGKAPREVNFIGT